MNSVVTALNARGILRSPAMNMIFHHPLPLVAEGRSGSSVRPRLMAQAFRAGGYAVTEVVGNVSARRRAIESVKNDIRNGRVFDFAYSESHTLPMPLTETHHLPTRPFLDYGFFAGLRRQGIPVGLFYRDAHWRFPELTPGYPIAKRTFVNAFHRFEWSRLRHTIDHLFLPLTQMLAVLPADWEASRVSSLPPGLEPRQRKPSEPTEGVLRLLYVGGVTPPLYDLTPLFEAARVSQQLRVTVSCRQEEWVRQAGQYDVPGNIEVVHASGNELDPLYANADAVAILWRPHQYLSLTLPVKLFEAMAYGLPIITTVGTQTAAFVAHEDVGWVVESGEDVARLTQRLLHNRDKLVEAYGRVQLARDHHTWQARVEQVAKTLKPVRG